MNVFLGNVMANSQPADPHTVTSEPKVIQDHTEWQHVNVNLSTTKQAHHKPMLFIPARLDGGDNPIVMPMQTYKSLFPEYKGFYNQINQFP